MAAASLDEALPAVAEAARLGMEETKDMIAATGKARASGAACDRLCRPGALSMYLILDFMAQYVTSAESHSLSDPCDPASRIREPRPGLL